MNHRYWQRPANKKMMFVVSAIILIAALFIIAGHIMGTLFGAPSHNDDWEHITSIDQITDEMLSDGSFNGSAAGLLISCNQFSNTVSCSWKNLNREIKVCRLYAHKETEITVTVAQDNPERNFVAAIAKQHDPDGQVNRLKEGTQTLSLKQGYSWLIVASVNGDSNGIVMTIDDEGSGVRLKTD
ncbi:hypothetical protein [Merdimmobilis hominis]|uniref:hypothetical protein n=1 Tax=Merdimmobilis hominis TaxID=2897707 RepID=UPI0011602554|nr:hypothetical protein [Merdimmobilis hominis]